MEQREVVRQRMLTLDGLLATPGGPFGDKADELAAEMRTGWEVERRLLQRILDDTKGDDVQGTIERWQERTAAFLDKADQERPSWSDRQGNTWDAAVVLRLLDDFGRRLQAWLDEGGGTSPSETPRTGGDGAHPQESPLQEDDDDDDTRYVSVLGDEDDA